MFFSLFVNRGINDVHEKQPNAWVNKHVALTQEYMLQSFNIKHGPLLWLNGTHKTNSIFLKKIQFISLKL